MNNGECSVLLYEEKVLQSFEKFLIYFPDKMINDNCIYPVIILSNGTGASMSIGCNKMKKQEKQFGEKMLKIITNELYQDQILNNKSLS